MNPITGKEYSGLLGILLVLLLCLSTVKTGTAQTSQAYATSQDTAKLWPVKSPPLLPGAILPAHRIIAFYGNLFAKRMGILGEYPRDTVLRKLQEMVTLWKKADSSKKILPALQLITVTAQSTPGSDGKYRMRMPFSMIDTVLQMAKKINAMVILDIQVGHSTVQEELPRLRDYLKLPQVGLAVEPEFSMKAGNVPGTKIGTMDAADINYCIHYLKSLVDSFHIPPKILVVHRFTQNMVTNYKNIKLYSQVQVIMDMDGFGSQALKRNTYYHVIYKEPVEYTGFKLFLKNDNWGDSKMMTPEQVLKLHPKPLYIQYQ